MDPLPAEQTLAWAAREFGRRVTFATGFGVEGCVIIDLIARNGLGIDLFTLDTGLLFPQTYALWKKLEERYGVTVRAVRPELDVAAQAAAHGDKLWERDPDRCCDMRKVIPLRRELQGFDAWVSAIRRGQTRDRGQAQLVERDPKFGLVKINPLADWSEKDVWDHVFKHQVPYNPLHDQGYPSIGCEPCTTPVAPGEDPRAGRWRGTPKNECGIHVRPEAPSAD